MSCHMDPILNFGLTLNPALALYEQEVNYPHLVELLKFSIR